MKSTNSVRTDERRAGRAVSTTNGKPAGRIGSTTPEPNALSEVAWGYVYSYIVDDTGLVVRFMSAMGAIEHFVSVGVTEPHFRTAVSLVMMAYHTPDTHITVRYSTVEVGAPGGKTSIVKPALQLAISKDPSKALEIE